VEGSLIIAVTNQKGGVGKTTTCINLSAALAFMGKRVLLVDMDPQAHSTISIVNNPTEKEKSLYDVLMNKKVPISEVIIRSTVPGLDVAISRISMAKLEPSLIGEFDGHYRLRDALSEVKENYDFIFIDTPPTLGLITLNALVAATHILIPIQSSYLCLEGTDDLLETIDKVKRIANPALDIIGIIITLHDRRTNLSRDVVERINQVFGEKVFKTYISKSVKLEESPAYKESIFTFAPESIGASQYKEIAEELLERGKN
jgi:chromosome partitioning protein